MPTTDTLFDPQSATVGYINQSGEGSFGKSLTVAPICTNQNASAVDDQQLLMTIPIFMGNSFPLRTLLHFHV